MSDSPYGEPQAVDQKPILNNWNQNEFGLQPRNLVERIAANFIKVFAYNFGFDANTPIWRALRSDVSGNLKVSNGAQSANPPLLTQLSVTGVAQQILPINTARRSFIINNDCQSLVGSASSLIIVYPNPNSSWQLILPVGWSYFDDDWQGTVSVVLLSGAGPQSITIAEFS